jgi:hypothetical protein
LISVDPRVYHGSTYSKHKPTAASTDVAPKLFKRRPRPPSPREPFTNPLTATIEREPRVDLLEQTAPYLQEFLDPTPVSATQTQTDSLMERPGSPVFIPPKTGLDIETQTAEDELFDFDREVCPIVATITSKTIEQAFMEVHEEEELANIRRQKEAIEHRRNAELAETLRLEEAERRLFAEMRRILEEGLAHEAEHEEVRAKVAARGFAEFFVSDLMSDAMRSLERRGYFFDEVERQIEDQFLPWLTRRVDELGDIHLLATAVLSSVKQWTLTYEARLRVSAAHAEEVKDAGKSKAGATWRRMMLVEDLGARRIRTARAGRKAAARKAGEEEDNQE